MKLLDHGDYEIHQPTSGGKAGKNNAKTSTIQVRKHSCVIKQIRFTVGDESSRAIALQKAKDFCGPVGEGFLSVNIGGRKGFADRDEYVTKKLTQLREFGYPSLTKEEVSEQVSAVLTGKEFGKGLTVIGMMISDEVIGPKTK